MSSGVGITKCPKCGNEEARCVWVNGVEYREVDCEKCGYHVHEFQDLLRYEWKALSDEEFRALCGKIRENKERDEDQDSAIILILVLQKPILKTGKILFYRRPAVKDEKGPIFKFKKGGDYSEGLSVRSG